MELLQTFATWFWISLVTSVATAAWWFIVAHRRETWLRWTNAEAAFWQRLKVPVATIESMKQKEQSKWFVYFVGGLCILWLLLLILNAGAYFYFREKLRELGPPDPVINRRADMANSFSHIAIGFSARSRSSNVGWE
jgi:hypothetical protein